MGSSLGSSLARAILQESVTSGAQWMLLQIVSLFSRILLASLPQGNAMRVSEPSTEQLPDPFAEYQCSSATDIPKSRYRPRKKPTTKVSKNIQVLLVL